MNLFAAIAASLLTQVTLAFVPSSQHIPKVVSMTALQAETKRDYVLEAAATASSFLVGLGLFSVQAAFAIDGDAAAFQQQQSNMYPTPPSSTIYLAEIEQFALPSYDSSKGSKLIDMTDDVKTVNSKTLQKAQAKREATDKSAGKLAADELRRAEKDGGSLLDSMIVNADKEKKAGIEAEIADSRANRWKTF